MRSFTHACGTHTRAVSLSLPLALSLVGPCCPAKRMLCMCFAPFLHDKGRRCCSEREAKSGKGRGREQIQFIFNIIFIVAAARDAEPKNRTEPNRTEEYRAGNQSKSIWNAMRDATKGFPSPAPSPVPAAGSSSSLCCLLCSSS